MVSLCSRKFNLSTLADKLWIVFETSKLKIVWWQCCFWKIGQSIRTENYLLITARCICQLNGRNNGFTTNDWWEKVKCFHFFRWFCPVINVGRILSALPLKIVPSEAKFVKSWQIIRICKDCKALVKWQKICLGQLFG